MLHGLAKGRGGPVLTAGLVLLAVLGGSALRTLTRDVATIRAGAHEAEPHGVSAVEFDRAKALAHIRSMPRYDPSMPRYDPSTGKSLPRASGGASSSAPSTWEFLGPGNIGGRARALVIDPVEPQTMYVGGVTGGVWKTTDGGQMWRPVGDAMSNMNIGSLAIDPFNRNVLYAGTGEIVSTGFGIGDGIFKSEDAGETWRQLPSPPATGAYPTFFQVPRLALSAKAYGRVYAATANGVYRSTDAGASWQRVLTATRGGLCGDIVVRSDQSPDQIVAVCGAHPGQLWRSTDGGDHWSMVFEPPESGRITLALAPRSQGTVYALASRAGDGNYLALYRSDDGGASWVTVHDGGTNCQLDGLFGGFGTYASVIAIDPMDSNRIWLGGKYLYRSDDGGSTWSLLGLRDHVDRHAIVFPPDFDGVARRTVFIGSDGGVSKSEDSRTPVVPIPCDGSDWYNDDPTQWTRLNNSLGITQFYHGDVSPDGTRFIGGTQDNGTLVGNLADGPDAWVRINSPGDGWRAAFDPNSADTLIFSGLFYFVFRSRDGGQTVQYVAEEFDTRFLGMDPNNPQILWLEGEHLWHSTDQGTTWKQASARLGPCCNLLHGAIAIAPGDSNHVLVARGSRIYRNFAALAAGSATPWESTSLGTDVSAVLFDLGAPGHVYATTTSIFNPHVWRSVDGGVSWSALDDPLGRDDGLPDLPVWSLAVDPAHRNRLFAGTEFGIFVSVDSGASWLPDGAGFPLVPTPELIIRSTASGPFLYAFTHGRGAYRRDISAYTAPPAQFRFTDQTGVEPGATVTSAPVTIIGLTEPADISVAGGSYSLGCTGSFTSEPGVVTNGSSVCVRHAATSGYGESTGTTLAVAGIFDTFTSTTRAATNTPSPFTFADQAGVAPGAVVTSDAVTISGLEAPAPISVQGGNYSIGCTAAFTSASGSIGNGQTVCVRHTASAGYNATTDTVLTIQGVSDTFSSTTRAATTTPNPFSFIDQTGVAPGAVVTSNPVTVSGLEAPAPISVQGGSYSIGCTATFTSASGTIGTGQTVCVRHTASGSYNATTDTVLTIQGVSDTFSSTTRAVPSAQPTGDAGGGGGALGWGLLWFLAGMASLRVGSRGG